jgi:ankyrin repeat protein
VSELLDAIENFDEHRMKSLLQAGADPNERGYGITPLHLAVDIEIQDAINRADRRNDLSPPSGRLVRLLLIYGADPTAVDESGKTALDWANEMDHKAAIEAITYKSSQ